MTPILLPVLPRQDQRYEVATTNIEDMLVTTSSSVGENSSFDWGVPLLILWGLGTVAFLFIVAKDARHLRRIVREGQRVDEGPLAESLRILSVKAGLRRPPLLLESSAISSPMIVGLFQPAVIVPAGFAERFGEQEREMALAHELAHLRRHDLWTGLIPVFARALFWFLPPLHWATREWETEREAACDAEAIALTHANPPSYGRLLLDIVAKDDRRPVASAIGATAGFHTLKRRLASVGQPDRPVPGFVFILPILAFLPWMPVPPAASNGLLLNGDLEAGEKDVPDHWTRGSRISSVRYVWDRETTHSGRGALAIFKTDDRYFPIAEWSQTVPIDGKSTAIEVSAWVRTEGMHKAVLDVQFLKEDGVASHAWAAYIGAKQDGDPPATHGWKRLGGILKIPPGTTEIAIAPQVYGPGKIWFDDIDARFTNEAPTTGESR
jgi:hypothetical protein